MQRCSEGSSPVTITMGESSLVFCPASADRLHSMATVLPSSKPTMDFPAFLPPCCLLRTQKLMQHLSTLAVILERIIQNNCVLNSTIKNHRYTCNFNSPWPNNTYSQEWTGYGLLFC